MQNLIYVKFLGLFLCLVFNFMVPNSQKIIQYVILRIDIEQNFSINLLDIQSDTSIMLFPYFLMIQLFKNLIFKIFKYYTFEIFGTMTT